MTGIGIVACGTLYPEVEAIRPDAAVRYVPQEYHEFPVSVPREDEIADRVQGAVDALDDPDRDRIVVIYAPGDGLTGIRSTHAPLVVSRAGDCISLFTHGVEPATMGEHRTPGTYYLTRGWIDCGVDSYKLYRAYLGEEADLLARFDRAGVDRRVTWADGDRYRRAVERGRSMSAEMVDRFFHRVVGYYERVKLIDTGHLRPFDHEYADSFRSFIETLNAEYGEDEGEDEDEDVELSVVEGDLTLLETLLGDEPPEGEFVDSYQPGTPVE